MSSAGATTEAWFFEIENHEGRRLEVRVVDVLLEAEPEHGLILVETEEGAMRFTLRTDRAYAARVAGAVDREPTRREKREFNTAMRVAGVQIRVGWPVDWERGDIDGDQ
jgi:hypothetical protein